MCLLTIALLTPGVADGQQGPTGLHDFWAFSALLDSPGLLRYNRIEGGSLGGRVAFGLRGWTGDLRGHIGWADRRPNLHLSVARRVAYGDWVVAAGAGLRGTQPYGAPLGLGNSLTSLLMGQDLGEYVREEAIRVGVRGNEQQWYVGLVASRERPVSSRSPWRMFDLRGGGRLDRPNSDAVATQGVGAEVRWVVDTGTDPFRPRVQLRGDAAARGGAHGFGSLSVRTTAVLPLRRSAPRRVRPSWSLRAETEVGIVSVGGPRQRLRVLGGAWSIRGWDPSTLRGRRWVLNRTLLEWHGPIGDLGAFHDVGAIDASKAGGTPAPSRSAAHSVGLGLGAVNGFVRVDVAWPIENRSVRLKSAQLVVALFPFIRWTGGG